MDICDIWIKNEVQSGTVETDGYSVVPLNNLRASLWEGLQKS